MTAAGYIIGGMFLIGAVIHVDKLQTKLDSSMCMTRACLELVSVEKSVRERNAAKAAQIEVMHALER